MKYRASLVLMEQLVMILVFALAACLCLQLFVEADRTAGEAARLDRAVVLAQNGAEAVKACGGDQTAALRLLGGAAKDGELGLELTEQFSGIAGLGQTRVQVVDTASGERIYFLDVFWQEVGR